VNLDLITARRKAIQDHAPCEGCGSTLASCKANRGKDPTAPPWLGCCARGLLLDIPCDHRPDPAALTALLKEIESGTVRSEEEVLLDSIREFSRPRRWLPPVCMLDDCGCSGEEHA
jgi:hypothetical protein